MTTPIRVLISSAGRRVELLRLWRRALASLELEGSVLGADISRLSAAYHEADHSFQVPRCTAPDFVPEMIELCRRERIAIVVPTIDTELPALAAARSEFAAVGTRVHVSAPEVIAIGYDKRTTHAWFVAQGLPTVLQAEPSDVLSAGRRWAFPLIAKPVRGSSSIGLARVENVDELARLTEGKDYVVQQIATGVEYTVDVFVDRGGRCRCAVPRRRLEVRAGEVSKGMTVREPSVIDLAVRVAEALPGAWGCLNIQIFHDAETGQLALIELNPRFGGGFPLSCEAGADYPRWILEEVLGRPSTAHDRWTDGLVMLRYDAAVFRSRQECGV
ncbi:MAG: ATP-grasp domain-containing protein [Myxococcales bacterium]|nr:ATP-grasp domain-containing protein [Myxococcales bacterium]